MRVRARTAGIVLLCLLFAAFMAINQLWRRHENQWLRRQLATEQERRALADRVLYLTKHANDIILLADHDWRILEANDRALEAYGYSLDELQRMSIRDLLAPEALPDVPQNAQRLEAHGAAVFETRHRRKNGSTFPVESSVRAVELGGAKYYLSILRDVTQRKQAEERLVKYQRRLRSLGAKLAVAEEQERQRIAADLHDDVGQTLSVAKMKLQAFRATLPPAAGAPLEEIEDLISRAVRSTRSLLYDLSPPVLYELGLEAAIEWLAEKAQLEYKLEAAVDDDRQAKPLSDEIRGILFRAVQEALHNTAKHAEAKHVRITSRREDARIRIEIVDDGKGFDPEKAQQPRDASAAFGLFHIRERLDYVGGRIEIHSQPGCGTRIVLVAPLSTEPPKA